MAWDSFIASGPERVAANDGTINFPSKWLRNKISENKSEMI